MKKLFQFAIATALFVSSLSSLRSQNPMQTPEVPKDHGLRITDLAGVLLHTETELLNRLSHKADSFDCVIQVITEIKPAFWDGSLETLDYTLEISKKWGFNRRAIIVYIALREKLSPNCDIKVQLSPSRDMAMYVPSTLCHSIIQQKMGPHLKKGNTRDIAKAISFGITEITNEAKKQAQ